MHERHRTPEERERLEEAELLAPGLIHEMRHPLMGLKGIAQLLERRLAGTVDLGALEEWGMLRAQLQRLEELFQHYQDFLHPEQVPPAPYRVEAVVERTVQLLAYRLRPLGRRFSLELPGTPVQAHGTPNSLAHALTNVLGNALDALEEVGGERRLAVRVLPLPGEGTVEVRVSDEGPGIPPETAVHIFTPRFTTKPRGKGTGLGLSLARRMLASCGAALQLAGEGEARRLPWARTEFVLVLPTAGPLRAPHPQRPPGSPGPAPAEEPPLRALVVDDESIILLLLRLTLTEARIDVTTASTGSEAADLLRAQRFDLLLTDKNLPGPSGVELATLARALDPGMAIVLMTGYTSRESAEALLAVGIDDYVTKPFDAGSLTARLRPLLARRRARALRPAPRRVVVAGEDPVERRGVLQALDRLGLQAEAVTDVLACLRTGPAPDALVAPASLLTAEVREALRLQQEQHPGLRVIALTEAGSLGDAIAAIAAGAHLRLVRPLTPAHLERALAGVLQEEGQ